MMDATHIQKLLLVFVIGLGLATAAMGQSSSLYTRGQQGEFAVPAPTPSNGMRQSVGELAAPNQMTILDATSFVSVTLPEPRKLKVHDLVTIIVKEQKKYESEADVKEGKDYTLTGAINNWFRVHDGKWLQQNFNGVTPEVDMTMKNSFKGDGKVEREDGFSTRITATVIDVKPNGNMILESRKRIQSDREVQVVVLTGECRSADITADNTILSTQIANLDIRINHSGLVRDTTQRGWIPQLFDWLRPF